MYQLILNLNWLNNDNTMYMKKVYTCNYGISLYPHKRLKLNSHHKCLFFPPLWKAKKRRYLWRVFCFKSTKLDNVKMQYFNCKTLTIFIPFYHFMTNQFLFFGLQIMDLWRCLQIGKMQLNYLWMFCIVQIWVSWTLKFFSHQLFAYICWST